jgi:hypothetical protein
LLAFSLTLGSFASSNSESSVAAALAAAVVISPTASLVIRLRSSPTRERILKDAESLYPWRVDRPAFCDASLMLLPLAKANAIASNLPLFAIFYPKQVPENAVWHIGFPLHLEKFLPSRWSFTFWYLTQVWKNKGFSLEMFNSSSKCNHIFDFLR